MLLHESAPIVGLWRLQGEGPRSSLIHFRWERDGIEGVEVEPRAPLTGRADASPWARICPARGLTTAVRVEPGGGHATVTVHGAHGQRIHRSPSAEAAAAVALPHSQVGVPAKASMQAGRPGDEAVGRHSLFVSLCMSRTCRPAAYWLPAAPLPAPAPAWCASQKPGCPSLTLGPGPAGQPLPPGHLSPGQL